jgi:hypothetical protein
MLYNAGAEINYTIGTRYGNKYLANVAASSANFQILLFLLHKDAPYSLSKDRGVDMHSSIQMTIDRGTISAKPEFPQYMWFWRCVKFLEQRGMTFHYGIYSPPAVLDTTPPESLNTAAAQAAEPPKSINMLMQQVDLTAPLPVWADTPETRQNVQSRQQQKGGTIIIDYLPQGQTEKDWNVFYTIMTAYTPGTTLDEAVRTAQETMRKGLGANGTITTEESAPDHCIVHFVSADATGPEGVYYLGRFMDTIVTLREVWRGVDAKTAAEYRAKTLTVMRQVVMKKGLTVLPMK